MRQFVRQNQLKLCVSNRQIFRQKDGRMKNAEGKRRTTAVAHADARIARKAEAVKQRINGRLRRKARSAKPTYHAGISDGKICRKKYRANEPDEKHRTDSSSLRCRFCGAVGHENRKWCQRV